MWLTRTPKRLMSLLLPAFSTHLQGFAFLCPVYTVCVLEDVCTTDMPDTHQGPSNPTLTVAAYLTWLSPYKAVMCDLLCGLTAAHPLTSTLPPRTLKSPQLFLLQQFSEPEESLACFLSVKIPWFYEICVFCSRELKTLHLSHRLSVNTPHKPGSR